MPKRLLPLEKFAPIFGPFRGKKVTLTEGVGWNPGDLILYRATEQLCAAFGVKWEKDIFETEDCLLFAGGNIQSPYAEEIKMRRQYIREALARKMSLTLLPQSFFPPKNLKKRQGRAPTGEVLGYVNTVFVREKKSLEYAVGAELAPDLALGYEFPDLVESEFVPTVVDVKHVLRRDLEGVAAAMMNIRLADPIRTKSVRSLLVASLGGHHIYTDRLHVAITAMAYGRDVTLIGNSYHKNFSMWETWLQELGCKFLEPAEYCSQFSRQEMIA